MKSEDILKRTSDLLGAKASEKEAMKSQLENERRLLITSLAQDISSIIQPTLENMIQANQVTIDSLKQAMREIKVDVPRTEVRMPTINVPRPQVNVSVPEMKVPTVNVPAPVINFPDKMSVSMDSVNGKSPLPVMMMDSFGKPMTFSMGAGGGGKADFLTIKDIRTSLGASWFNDEGLRVSGSFSVTASNSSTQAIDSSGEAYSGSNPVPVTLISGGLVSTIAVGSVVADAVDDGSAPVQSGGIARTANPTAVAGGDVVKSTHDDLGRQVMKVNQVRDLLATAYVSLTTGTETTLLSATAGFYYDLVYIMGANASDAVATVDIRPVTGGNIVMTLVVPPYGTAGVSLPTPLPQTGSDGTGNNWTADMNDITGTTVYVSALFSKEV